MVSNHNSCTLQVACFSLLFAVVASIPELPVKTEYDVKLEKVVAHIKANGDAFHGLVSFTSDTPLTGNHDTKFTKFSIVDTSVAGYETTRQASFAKGEKLGDNAIQFSGSILVNNLRISGIMNFEVKDKSYSVPFVAQRLSPSDSIQVTIEYNETTKSAQVIAMKHKSGPGIDFSIQSDCFTSDKKTYLGVSVCSDMKDVASRTAFAQTNNISKAWDEKLKKLIESTVF